MARKKPLVKVTTKTTDTDRGLKKLKDEMKKFRNKPHVKAGFPAEFKPGDSKKTFSIDGGQVVETSDILTVLDVAVWNEFGTETIPERSFLRSAFDKNRAKYEKHTKSLLIQITKGTKTTEQALDILGLMLETDIKSMIRNGEFTALSDVTVRRKGSDKPLIDTAQMLNSVRHKVKLKKKKTK